MSTIQAWVERVKVVATSIITLLTGLVVILTTFADEIVRVGLPEGVSGPVAVWALRAVVLLGAVIKAVRTLVPAPAETRGILIRPGVELLQTVKPLPTGMRGVVRREIYGNDGQLVEANARYGVTTR